MGLSRIWGVRGSRCCRFQQVTLSNIKYALKLILRLKTHLWSEKYFKKAKIPPFLSNFPLIFSYQAGKNIAIFLKNWEPPNPRLEGSDHHLSNEIALVVSGEPSKTPTSIFGHQAHQKQILRDLNFSKTLKNLKKYKLLK